jgi:hypothetical protein
MNESLLLCGAHYPRELHLRLQPTDSPINNYDSFLSKILRALSQRAPKPVLDQFWRKLRQI